MSLSLILILVNTKTKYATKIAKKYEKHNPGPKYLTFRAMTACHGAAQARKADLTRRRMKMMLRTVSDKASARPAPRGSQGLASVAPMPRMEAR